MARNSGNQTEGGEIQFWVQESLSWKVDTNFYIIGVEWFWLHQKSRKEIRYITKIKYSLLKLLHNFFRFRHVNMKCIFLVARAEEIFKVSLKENYGSKEKMQVKIGIILRV